MKQICLSADFVSKGNFLVENMNEVLVEKKNLFKATPAWAFVTLIALGASIFESILKSSSDFASDRLICNLCQCQQDASGSLNTDRK